MFHEVSRQTYIRLPVHIYNTIQYNNHLVKRSLIETPLRERPYSSLAASLNGKKLILKLYSTNKGLYRPIHLSNHK